MADAIRTIKKYPNRRLYDTANSGYITLADVKQMVLENIDFQVVDAKSGEDLTRAILLQIILEEESGGLPMFSSEMLAQMIRFYGSAQQTMMGQYMEQNVKAFMSIQKIRLHAISLTRRSASSSSAHLISRRQTAPQIQALYAR